MPYSDIDYAVAQRIATLTLDRPHARNGYTERMADELADALRAADADDEVRVVVLTGAGENFCVGADLSGGSLATHADAEGAGWLEPASRVTRPMFAMRKPIIAAVRGAAVGVGSTMLLPADYRLAATDSRFGFVFTRRGIYPEGGSTWFLPRLVGLGRAMDWMISGRLVPAEEARAAGLVHSVHRPDEVLARAYELARGLIATAAPVSTAVIRQALYRMSALDSPEAAFALDSQLIASCEGNPDAREGVASFLQRRPPRFTGVLSRDLPDFLPWNDAGRDSVRVVTQLRPQRRGRKVAMTPAEIDAFLAEERTCRVATIGADGPHATPLWFGWDGTHLWLYSIVKSQRWTDLRRDPRIGITVDSGVEYAQLRGVEITGTVEVVGAVPRTGEPDDALGEIEAQFARKYMGGGTELFHDGRHGWLRVTPAKIASWDFRKL